MLPFDINVVSLILGPVVLREDCEEDVVAPENGLDGDFNDPVAMIVFDTLWLARPLMDTLPEELGMDNNENPLLAFRCGMIVDENPLLAFRCGMLLVFRCEMLLDEFWPRVKVVLVILAARSKRWRFEPEPAPSPASAPGRI